MSDEAIISVTAIKKNSKIASVGSSKVTEPSTVIDSLTINDMVHDIDILDEESHEQIYLLIRGFKPASFFTTDRGGGGTHFDRTQLTDRQIHELYRTVQFCKENMKRKQVLLSAMQEMERDASVSIQKLNGV